MLRFSLIFYEKSDLSRLGECLRLSGFIIFIIGGFYFPVSLVHIARSRGGSAYQPVCARVVRGARVAVTWFSVDFSVSAVR